MIAATMIAIGGALGALARYALFLFVHRFATLHFPYGILTVNLVGCFLMGLIAPILIHKLLLSAIWRQILLVGFLGSFTKFSTFSWDTILLFEEGAYFSAVNYVLMSVIGCLVATFLGLWMGRFI
jgi:CrcB protein